MSKFRLNQKGYSVQVLVLAVLVLAGLMLLGYSLVSANKTNKAVVIEKTSTKSTSSKTVVAPSTQQQTSSAPNPCSGNTLSQLVLVSTSQRHMWACAYTTNVYDSAVITGMDFLAADITPAGTYHIYAKEQGVSLKGSDSTGSWDDYVYYWMPFLDNQYGIYGFHDATWRAANAFGNISPDSNQASHGCVEMPIATAKWLYGWAVVGTTVTIES